MWLPEALQNLHDLPSDEEPDVRDLLREARRVKERARRREKEEKEREEREGLERDERLEMGEKRKRVKPFPVRKEREKEKKRHGDGRERSPSLESHVTAIPALLVLTLSYRCPLLASRSRVTPNPTRLPPPNLQIQTEMQTHLQYQSTPRPLTHLLSPLIMTPILVVAGMMIVRG
jgi:hypothetical protein